MADEQRGAEGRPLPEGLRAAIERTFAATAGSAAGTRGRAQDLLDEVSRRGQDARDAVTRRRQEAGQASAEAANRVIEAIEGMRLATRDDLRTLDARLDELAKRIAELERLADRVASLEQQPPGGR